MAYEIKPWKTRGCTLSLKTSKITDRETFSQEINEQYGEGGGLNANYRTVEAVAMASNALGTLGFKYNKDFVFKTAGLDEIVLDFADLDTLIRGDEAIVDWIAGIKHPIGEKCPVHCLICGGEMKLEVYETTSYWQCGKDQTHRMSLSEWSEIRGGDNKEKVLAAMKERQLVLQKQVK